MFLGPCFSSPSQICGWTFFLKRPKEKRGSLQMPRIVPTRIGTLHQRLHHLHQITEDLQVLSRISQDRTKCTRTLGEASSNVKIRIQNFQQFLSPLRRGILKALGYLRDIDYSCQNCDCKYTERVHIFHQS